MSLCTADGARYCNLKVVGSNNDDDDGGGGLKNRPSPSQLELGTY